MTAMKTRFLAAALVAAFLAISALAPNAHAQTATPTATVSPTPTPTPGKPPRIEQHKQRDFDTSAKLDTAAPTPLTLVATTGAVVDNAVYRTVFANSFRLRGVTTSIAVVGSECTLTLTVDGVTKNVTSLVGRANAPNYIYFGTTGVDVPAGAEVAVKTEVTGTNTGLVYVLDVIPSVMRQWRSASWWNERHNHSTTSQAACSYERWCASGRQG